MLRNLLVLAIGFAAGAVHAQANCDPATFTPTCTGNTLNFCSTQDAQGQPLAQPITSTADCTFPPAGGGAPQSPNGTCAAVNCVGDGCYIIDKPTCVSGNTDPCLGISPLLDADTTNDNLAFAVLCSAGNSCVTTGSNNQLADVCQAQVSASCTQSGQVGCDGQRVFICLGGSEDRNNNGTLDPAAGTTPAEDGNGNGTIDTFTLPEAFAMDCATFGGTCNASATTGPVHSAFAVTQALADCDIPAAGEGEGEGGAGEGEGEGGAACDQDSQCGRDKVCTNHVCKAKNDTPATPPGCSDTGSSTGLPLAGLLGFIALVPMFRRRR